MSEANAVPPQLAVVLGRADDMRAVVYVRLLDGGRIEEGTLRGPRCRHAATLPTTAAVRVLPPLEGGGADLPTGEAILVEPGFWSPELPNRYQVQLTLSDSAGRARSHSQMVGVCRLGHRDGGFRLDGRRYVPRAVPLAAREDVPAAAAASVMAEARQASAALWSDQPSAAVCEAADAEGVMLFATIPSGLSPDQATREAARLAVHPAVGFLVLSEMQGTAAREWRGFRSTMQVGLLIDGSRPPPETANLEGIDFLVAEVADAAPWHDRWQQRLPLPVVVRRASPQAAGAPPMQQQRRACDRLQADMAAWLAGPGRPAWEPAGYMV